MVEHPFETTRFALFHFLGTASTVGNDDIEHSRRRLWTLLRFLSSFSLSSSLRCERLPLDLAVAPVARLVHYQNIPLITMGAVSNEFTLLRESMYSTLFRFGYRTDELGQMRDNPFIRSVRLFVGTLLVKLFEYYQWTFVKFVYEDQPHPWHECQVLLKPISHKFSTNRIRSDNRKITQHDVNEQFRSIFLDFISNNASGFLVPR